MDTKSMIRIISLILFSSVFTVWGVFYVIISGYIAASTEKQIALAAGQIIERLDSGFSEALRLTYTLKRDAGAQALAREQDRRRLFAAAGETAAAPALVNTDFVNSVILYGADSYGFQLTGTLGSKSCSRLHNLVSSLELPRHLSAELDGKKYIGYADSIAGEGAVVVLIEEEKILEILRAYDQSGSLLVEVRAGGETVTANTDRAAEIISASRTAIHSGLGVTPYEISVAADARYMRAQILPFSAVALITAVLFAALLFIYTRILNRRFIRPMVSVIGSIDTLDTEKISGVTLPRMQNGEFDRLIDKINEMLVKLERKQAEVLAAEIGRQKATVLSLQKQINAHFTVNTLEAIRTAVEQGELAKAEDLMSGLTRIVRYAHSGEETVNIWDESEMLKYYANIMSNRYGGKLTAELDFDERLMDTDMPRMLLQPLMENAVVHGFKDMDSGCVISVKAELRGGSIRFTVSDNGGGMGAAELSALRQQLGAVPGNLDGLEHIAMLNIRNRLYYYYGGAALFSVNPSGSGGLEVTVEIPIS